MADAITDAMIEAGVKALRERVTLRFPHMDAPTVEEIYLAMEAARQPQLPSDDGLIKALERLERNFDLLLAGKPVRDVEETKAEVRRVLSRHKAPLSVAGQTDVEHGVASAIIQDAERLADTSDRHARAVSWIRNRAASLARAAIAAMQQPVHANETQRDFAWTATSGYKFYPPFVNLSKRDESYRLSVRAEETIDEKGHPRTGPQLEINLPPEAIAELRAALLVSNRSGAENVDLIVGLQQVRYVLRSVANGDDQSAVASKAVEIIDAAIDALRLTALQVTEGDKVERLIEARKVVAKEYRRLGLNPNPVLRGDFDAGVEVQAALRSQCNKVSKPL